MEDAVCTAVPLRDREPPKGWSGRAVLAEKHGQHSTEVLAEQKRVRELLAQSRELLRQMQAD